VALCVGIGFAPSLHSLDPFLVATLLAAMGLVTGAVVAWRMPAPAPAADLQEQAG
jgi:DHA2 family lincomycin resistance protein-like MFS transporter